MIQDRHRIASEAGDATMAHHDRGHLLAEVKRLTMERATLRASCPCCGAKPDAEGRWWRTIDARREGMYGVPDT
jgi:hypothetical protein